jgi:signal transduction histidine kinase
MFNKIRHRLLFSYLLVFASILAIFAVAVRILVARSLNDIFTGKLIALGQDAAANTNLKEGRIRIDDDVSVKDLLAREQVLEWFDLTGNRVAKQGQYVTPKPHLQQASSQIKIGEKVKPNTKVTRSIKKYPSEETTENSSNIRVKSIILPLFNSNNNQLIGYVKVSQSLKELEEDLQELDWGLGTGIIVALILSGISGIFLTRQAMQPIEDSFQRLQQFTADASHELRSPLMAIKTNAQVALKYPEGIREPDREKFNIIVSASQQITQLTEDLLFLARSDKLPGINKNKIKLTAILEDLFKSTYLQFEAKQITLIPEIEPDLFLLGDSGQIRRLFNNLIANALYYTPSGGTVEIKANSEGAYLYVKVRDTGIGIAPENLSHIFERFWRENKSRSYWEGGSGLGLAIAQTIAQNHGGLITVTSELGVGSCFTVRLLSDSHHF